MITLHWSTAKKSSRLSQLILDNSNALNPKMPRVFLYQVKFSDDFQFSFFFGGSLNRFSPLCPL